LRKKNPTIKRVDHGSSASSKNKAQEREEKWNSGGRVGELEVNSNRRGIKACVSDELKKRI